MFFLLNDVVLDVDPNRFLQPLEADRFAALGIDYIAQLGKEMFADDPQAHRSNPERARRLCYLIHLKMPRINAAQFFVATANGQPEGVEAKFESIHEMALGMMLEQQSAGLLDARKVDAAVWHRMAA